MAEQTITILPNGSAVGLRSKKGVDLRKLGKVNTVRTTDIKFDELTQKWYFVFLRGVLKGHTFTFGMKERRLSEPNKGTGPVLFEEYEDAVEEEIRVVNKLRSIYGEGIV